MLHWEQWVSTESIRSITPCFAAIWAASEQMNEGLSGFQHLLRALLQLASSRQFSSVIDLVAGLKDAFTYQGLDYSTCCLLHCWSLLANYSCFKVICVFSCKDGKHSTVAQCSIHILFWHFCIKTASTLVCLKQQGRNKMQIKMSSCFFLQHPLCRHCGIHQLSFSVHCSGTGQVAEWTLWEVWWTGNGKFPWLT